MTMSFGTMIWEDAMTGIRHVDRHGDHRPCIDCERERHNLNGEYFQKGWDEARKQLRRDVVKAIEAELENTKKRLQSEGNWGTSEDRCFEYAMLKAAAIARGQK